MSSNIDDKLDAAFTAERVSRAFFEYKYSKWDHFSKFDDPKINIPMGADGIHALAFEKQLGRHARNITRRIQEDSYVFYPFREVDKKKDKTLPLRRDNTRTLGIASIRDALVQSILYQDVLYETIETLFRELDSPDPVSYAYRKGKSAPKAAEIVSKYIEKGYKYVLDADLSKYFDTIPHDKLLAKLAIAIGGDISRTYQLVSSFIHTDRVPHRSYRYFRGGKRIFHRRKPLPNRSPRRIIRKNGVPQGGILSGMLANLYLHDFDTWIINNLGKQFDLKYVRYADDFIILVKDKNILPLVRDLVQDRLKFMELGLSKKKKPTDIYVIKDGLDFVGFHFDGHCIRVRDKNIDGFKSRIEKKIGEPPAYVTNQNNAMETLKWLVRRINLKVQGLSGLERCPKCGQTRIGPPRSWMAFFQVVTNVDQLREMDKWIRNYIYNYVYDRYRVRLSRTDLKKAGLRSLRHERRKIGKTRLRPCLCDIEALGVWHFVRDLYLRNKMETLARKRPFYVLKVSHNEMQLLIGKTKYIVDRNVFESLWKRLIKDSSISRAQLETEGFRNTSQLVTLLSELPSVHMQRWPIELKYFGAHPAPFMVPRN